jgi:GMP synthase (glutamine-hydrolysing)
MTKQINASQLNAAAFIKKSSAEIGAAVKDLNACLLLSGGISSSVMALLAHRVLGSQLKVFFIDNGLMRLDEPRDTFLLFKKFGIEVTIINARKDFTSGLAGKTDPEHKKDALLQMFYIDTLNNILKLSKAKYLLHTAYSDNSDLVGSVPLAALFKKFGHDPQSPFGSILLEPFAPLRRDALQKLGKELRLPAALYAGQAFPLTALAGRVLGEATSEKMEIIRRATVVVDSILTSNTLLRPMAVLHTEKVAGMANGKKIYGPLIEIRAWEKTNAKTSNPARLSAKVFDTLSRKIMVAVPGIAGISYNITPLPPATLELL